MSESTAPAPRIPPGGVADIGRVNMAINRLAGMAMGTGPPNVGTTLARDRKVFRSWMRFANSLMPNGLLVPSDSELLILRAAHNCGCEYEWHHHSELALTTGLTREDVARVRDGALADGWPEHRRDLLAAADELHADRVLSDEVFARLRTHYDEARVIEVCLLVGMYEMLAMALNTAGTQVDAPVSHRGPVASLVKRLSGFQARRSG